MSALTSLAMQPLRLLLPLAFFLNLAAAAEPPPAKALKYHEALLKRPANETLFDRFFSAWIDEQDISALEAFLTSRAEKNSGADLSVLARYQLRRGNEDAALETLGKAIPILPEDFSLPMERAKILLRRLEFESARKDLATVAAGKDPAVALEASKLIGKSWLREGNPEQAIKTWDALLAAHPGDEDLLEDLVESAAAESETEQALKYVDKLIAAGSDPYKKTLRQLRRGDLLAQAGRQDDAVAAYSATLAEVGEGSWLEREVLAQIDKAYRKQDRIGDLKDKLAELAAANPRRLLIHRELARIEAAQGETDAAVGRFREVLKRTPGNRELREEFVRLLTDGEKYDEAATELEKLIALAPEDSGLLLQMADLRNREGNKETTLAALQKAHALLGPEDESSGVRISGLMFQYGLAEAGEKLLLKLAAAQGASEAPSEALAAEYARTNRKPEALAILEKTAASENLETVLRAAGTISALSETATALKVLSAKEQAFGKEPRFLAAISQAALAAGKPEIAVNHAVKLVRLASQGPEIGESIALALRAIADAEKTDDWRATLEKQATRTASETCLLAALADSQSDFDAVTKIMAGAKDHAVIRFHAALLDRRGEFEQAIAALSPLTETEEGRKASFFKDMADLQRRAGKTNEALATVELWKQSAPGDKTAWITGGSILREQGRAEEAVKAARQAVARFGEDNDLAATLASLHEDAGQTGEAEAIYWRLYDGSQSPSDQARWSVRLAELSMNTGRAEEFAEKLRERARGNRRSIGPILAQAELARLTRDEDRRRDLLLEAVRLQPKDIDLRLQIANLEEQGGNPERVIAILEEAVAADTTHRVRSALAQAYLRQGQTLKGMRELRALAGKQSDDPRAIEQSAASLAGSGLFEEAIRFLRETLPDGGDWRTRYLLAIMLEHDGRETEAIPLFQALRQASGELPTAAPTPNTRRHVGGQWSEYPESVREIIRILSAAQAAYAHRNSNNHYGGYQQGGLKVGPFMLPDTAENVRSYALVHLTKLGALGGEENAFLKELVSVEFGKQPDFPAMLSKYPEQPGLLEIVLLYAGWNSTTAAIDPDLLRKLLAKKKDLSPEDRFRAQLTLATLPNAPESAWQDVVASSRALTADMKAGNLTMVCYQMLGLLNREGLNIPDAARKDLTEMLLALATRENLKDSPLEGFHLVIFVAVGTKEQWITAANKEIEDFRKDAAKGSQTSPRAGIHYGMAGMRPWTMGDDSPFTLPTMEDLELTSLPPRLLQMIRSDSEGGFQGTRAMDPVKLLPDIDSFNSPILRAFIAMRAENPAAAEKALAATAPEIESADFDALRAIHAIGRKDFPAAYKLLSGRRTALASNRNSITSLNFQLLAVAAEMTPDQRKEISGELAQLLIQSRQSLGNKGAPLLAAQARILGLTELEKRFAPPAARQTPGGVRMGTANFATNNNNNNNNRSSSSGNATIEKLKKFSADSKNEAAALEALNLIRKASASRYNRSSEIRQVREAVTPEVLAELMKLIEPGDSKSLTKLTEYADICLDFGKRDQALAVLNRIHAERPDDATIAAKLAFSLPADQRENATALFNSNAARDGFPDTAHSIAEGLSDERNDERTFAFFDSIATWLETARPEALAKANLTWVAYHAKSFHGGSFSSKFSGLDSIDPAQYKDNKEFARHTELAKRLALAMLRHASIAEEGFRLLRSSRSWQLPDAEMDNHARTALIAGASLKDDADGNHRYFQFRTSNNGSSSGDSLPAHSSVGWISARLAAVKSPDEILPPAYLADLRAANAGFGELAAALASIQNTAELEKLWKSEALAKATGPFAEMLRDAVLTRASTVPDAGAFFLKLLAELKPGSLLNNHNGPFGDGGSSSMPLIKASLMASASGDAKDLPAACEAISNLVFGEEIDLSDTTSGMKTYQAINTMESMFEGAKLPPAAAIRVHREFHRLGVPVSSSEYRLAQTFGAVRATSPEDLEKSLASFGWLDPVDTWRPFAAILCETDGNGGKIRFTRKDAFLVPEALDAMTSNISDSAVARHLEQRKPQTFGALVTAASVSEGRERERLTALAFSTNAAQLASMPKERLADFAPLLPWLPKDALAGLPPLFREKAEGANTERIAKLTEAADAFMKNTPGTNNPFGNNSLDQVGNLVRELIPLDLPKAVALFLEAERRFTASLSRGGSLSSYTSSNMQITERDEALEELIASSNSPTDATALNLSFYEAVVTSPESTRFSYSVSDTNTTVLFRLGHQLYSEAFSTPGRKEQPWFRAFKEVGNLPEALRMNAALAVGSYVTGRNQVSIQRSHFTPEETDLLCPQARTVFNAAVGVRCWKVDSLEEREKTRNALISIVTDPKIPFPTRFQSMAMAATTNFQILADPAIADTCAVLFEEYAQGERSVINSVGIHYSTISAIAPDTESIKPALTRLNKAFWDNANTVKPGGHPTIPHEYADELLISASVIGDETTVKKLFNLAKANLLGNVFAIRGLIATGNHIHAKDLLLPANMLYKTAGRMPPNTRHMEQRLNEFRNTPGLDPIACLRLEAILMDLSQASTGPDKPLESDARREQRIIATYRANPPADKFLRTEIISRLTRDSHTAAIGLRDELLSLRKELDLGKALNDCFMGLGSRSDPAPRRWVALSECVIFRQGAFLQLLDGDASGLNELVQVVSAQQPAKRWNDDSSPEAVRDFLERFCTSAPIWIAEAIHRDKTDGFKAALEPFEKLITFMDSRPECGSWDVTRAVTAAEFLAYWNGDSTRCENMRKQLKHHASDLGERRGLLQFMKVANFHRSWKHPEFAETRRDFLVKTLSRNAMSGFFGPSDHWLIEAASAGDIQKELLEIAAKPPETIVAPALAHLLNYRSDDEYAAKRIDSGIAAAMAAINACPTEQDWWNTITRWRLDLVERLINSKQLDKAKEIYAEIKPDAVASNQVKRHEYLGARLAKAQP
jgi:predicted Zn-dependent protease